MSKIIDEPIDINSNDLISQIAGNGIRDNYRENYFDGNDGRFIACKSNGLLISCCYHKNKEHTAVAEVHNGFTKLFGASDRIVRSSKGSASGGKWAIAYTDSGKLGGDEAYFICD